MKRITFCLAAVCTAIVASAGLREDFAQPKRVRGVNTNPRAMFDARCAMLLKGNTPKAQELSGISLETMARNEVAAFRAAQAEIDGTKVFCFAEKSGRFPRELEITPKSGLNTADAEVWNPQDGTAERPFVENGRIRIAVEQGETLFLVWPSANENKIALPPRMVEVAGPEENTRVSSQIFPAIDGGAALEDTAWIWHPDAKKEKGSVIVRSVFAIPQDAKIASATLTFTCDNGAIVKINGKEIARQKSDNVSWQNLSVKNAKDFLKPGENVIEAACDNIAHGDSGFIASLDIATGTGVIRIHTGNGKWEASLDGKAFKPAWSAGLYGCKPWLRFNENGRATQRPLVDRREQTISFNCGKIKPAGRLFLVCDGLEGGNDALITVNGTPVGGFAVKPYKMEVSRYVSAGDNSIFVQKAHLKKPRLVWTAPATGPYDLRCEYQREPLGAVNPRFFWKVAGSDGGNFKFSLRKALDGSVLYTAETKENLYIEPKLTLEPWTRYVWSVEGRGGKSSASFVSGIDKWRMPFFKPGWKLDPLQYWVARKEIEVNGAKSAIVSVTSFGSHRLYVNGVPASDGIGSNRSHIEDGIVLAQTYDITRLLKDGRNEFAIYVNNGWTGMSLCKEKESAISIDGAIATERGIMKVNSAEPWTVAKSRDSACGPTRGNYNGDLRGIEKLHDMEELTLTQSGVVRTGKPFSVSCDVSDRDWTQHEIHPHSIEQVAPLNGEKEPIWKIDMGEEFTGFLRLKLKGEKGTTARMTVSDTFVDRCTFGQVAEFTFCGGNGIFENRLNWQSGRFLYLTGCDKPSSEDITGIILSSVGRRTGNFTGDRDLSTILALDNDTMIAATQCGVTVDCPHRERLGYGETGISSMWGNMHFFDTAAFYYAYLQKWASSQEPNGHLPHVSPDGWGWGGTGWSNYPVYGTWEFIRSNPDPRLLSIMRPVVDKWLDYLNEHVKDGTLEKYEPGKGNCLGDWVYPEIHYTKHSWGDWGDTVEGLFFNNCSYALAILRALDTPGLVTDPARRDELKRRHATLVDGINRAWYKDGIYVSEDARYQAIALLGGVAKDHYEQTENLILDIVERKGYVDGGSPSYTMILRALCQSKRGRELALRAFRRHSPPGFLFFADEGYNTIPEDWWYGRNTSGSMIHTCYTGPAGALVHGFAGFEVDGRNVTVAPLLSDTLPNFSAHMETLHGTLALKVESRGEKRIVWITLPQGCKGKFLDNTTHELKPGINRFETLK